MNPVPKIPDESFERAIRTIIQYIGDDPDRDGLKDTPARVLRSYAELFSGYSQKPEDIIKTFDDIAADEMIVLRDIEITSVCEHHLLPFVGKAHVGYVPDGRVIGLSKLARLVEIYSRRLQVQERLTCQVTAALDKHLKTLGSACVVECRHLCVCARGVRKQHGVMVTSSLTGVFRRPEVRQEFFGLVRG